MALPLSGQLSFSAIRTELGVPSQAPFSITTAATGGYVAINQSSPAKPNSSAPHAVSEWYGYNQTYSATKTLYINFNWSRAGQTLRIYKNGTNILTYTSSVSTTTTINTGDAVYATLAVSGSINVDAYSVLHMYSNDFVYDYELDMNGLGTLTLPSHNVLAGKDYTINADVF